MIQNKTRIRLTWLFMIMCISGMILGALLKQPNVIVTSLASASGVVMMYIGGKTWDNVKRKENEKTN